jgi:hypothetical protein
MIRIHPNAKPVGSLIPGFYENEESMNNEVYLNFLEMNLKLIKL